MKKVFFLVIFGLFACSEEPNSESPLKDEYTSPSNVEHSPTPDSNPEKPESPKKVNGQKVSNLSYRVFFTETVGWGYQLFEGNTLLLKQEYIPAIQGNHAFENKQIAEKTAKYVLEKVESGIFPPTLSVAELDSLGALPPGYKR